MSCTQKTSLTPFFSYLPYFFKFADGHNFSTSWDFLLIINRDA